MTEPNEIPPDIRRLAAQLLEAYAFVDADADAISEIMRDCQTRALVEGEVLCSEDEPGTELFFLLDGAMSVYKRDPRGEQHHIGEVRAPSLLGQMAIIDRSWRTATCIASKAAIVAVMDEPTFHDLVHATTNRGLTLRRLLLSSLTLQLVQGNARLKKLLDSSGLPLGGTGADQLSENLIRTAGILDGWTRRGR